MSVPVLRAGHGLAEEAVAATEVGVAAAQASCPLLVAAAAVWNGQRLAGEHHGRNSGLSTAL